jgi:hypothetical protein
MTAIELAQCTLCAFSAHALAMQGPKQQPIAPSKGVPIGEYVEGRSRTLKRANAPAGFVSAADLLRPSPSLMNRLEQIGVSKHINISRSAEVVRSIGWC